MLHPNVTPQAVYRSLFPGVQLNLSFEILPLPALTHTTCFFHSLVFSRWRNITFVFKEKIPRKILKCT
jgi:hypothetical protein